MLFSIKERICRPISIRYTLKSLIQYGKIANLEKITKFLKNYLRILQKFSMNSAKKS